MTEILAVAALGLAGYYFAPSYLSESEQQTKNQLELREANHTGFLRRNNTSGNAVIESEETRVIRNPRFSPTDVMQNASKSWLYFKEKNDKLASIGYGVNALINAGTLRPDVRKKPGLPQFPSRDGWGEMFGNLPNATFDIDSGLPADQMTFNWRDQYGDSGGFPRDGRPNVVLNELYTGNAWGVGGQLFEAVGNQYRDPQYPDNPPEASEKVTKENANTIMKKRVHFQ